MDVRVGLWRKLSTKELIPLLEKTPESPLDCTEFQPVHSEGDQPWDFFGGNDAEAETPILWPPDAKNWLTGKDHDAGNDWRQEKKGMTEDEMVGCYHWLNGCKIEQTPGVSDGQGSLVCCSPWGHKETWLSNWTEDQCQINAHMCVSMYMYTQWSITQPWKAWNLAICSNRDGLGGYCAKWNVRFTTRFHSYETLKNKQKQT